MVRYCKNIMSLETRYRDSKSAIFWCQLKTFYRVVLASLKFLLSVWEKKGQILLWTISVVYIIGKNQNLYQNYLFTCFNCIPWKKQVIHHATFQNWETKFFLFGSRKIWKSFPHIGKVFVKLGQNFGQNFTIFSKNQKQCQLPGVGLISKYKSLL